MSTDSDVRRPFQFSLRTFLIVTSVVGVGSGLLGQLFLRSPETFLAVIVGLSTLLPFVLAIGTIIRMGVRGRRRGLIVWGILLALMPVAGIGAVAAVQFYVGPGGQANLRMRTTQQLIATELPKQIDEPWVWRELETRLAANSLSRQEVDDAVKALISHMSAKAPQGWNQPLPWQQGFLKSATQAGMVSLPVFINLCDAFFGPSATIRSLPRRREGNGRLEIEVNYGSVWTSSFGPSVELLWQVNRVLLDGKPIAFQPANRSNQEWWGSYVDAFTAGQHELTVEIECAYVDAGKLIGLNSTSLPKEQWPKALKRWTQSVSAPLNVFAAGAPIVALTTSPDHDPGPGGGIRIQRFVVQSDQGGKSKIVLVAESIEGIPVALSYDVSAVVGGQSVNLGNMWIYSNVNSTARGGNLGGASVAALDPSVKSADIILTPNPKYVDERPEIKEIWGKKVILRRVPLERLDLEVKSSSTEQSPPKKKPASSAGKSR